MKRTDIYFAHNYEMNAFPYCIKTTDIGWSDIKSVVKDTTNARVSIYGNIHGYHLLNALETLAKMKGYKPIDIVTITL